MTDELSELGPYRYEHFDPAYRHMWAGYPAGPLEEWLTVIQTAINSRSAVQELKIRGVSGLREGGREVCVCGGGGAVFNADFPPQRGRIAREVQARRSSQHRAGAQSQGSEEPVAYPHLPPYPPHPPHAPHAPHPPHPPHPLQGAKIRTYMGVIADFLSYATREPSDQVGAGALMAGML